VRVHVYVCVCVCECVCVCARARVHVITALLHESMLASLSTSFVAQPLNAMPTIQSCGRKPRPAWLPLIIALFHLSLGPDRSCLLQTDEVGCLLLLLCRQADLAGTV
jgi:hypothetical protein